MKPIAKSVERTLSNRTLLVLVAAVALSAGLGAITTKIPMIGIMGAGAVAGSLLLMAPRFLVLVAGVALPFVFGINVGGLTLAISDLALMAALAGFVLIKQTDVREAAKLIGPAWWVIYGVAGYLGIAAAEGLVLGKGEALMTVIRRIIIIMVPLVVGILMGSGNKLVERLILLVIIASCVLAFVWILNFSDAKVLGVNKNPGGQMMANCAILLLIHRKLRPWQYLALGLLVVGILATGSRGSLIGLGIGFGILMMVRYSEALTWKRLVAIIGMLIIALMAAPSSVTERLFSENESGQYNADIRLVFVADALSQSEGNLTLGHGVGTYLQVDPALSRVESHDPHNVYALQIFEGGIILLLAFVTMSLVPVLVLWPYRRDHIVLAALALHISLVLHCYVDIYWVRGTPTLAWLLIGVALSRISVLKKQAVTGRGDQSIEDLTGTSDHITPKAQLV